MGTPSHSGGAPASQRSVARGRADHAACAVSSAASAVVLVGLAELARVPVSLYATQPLHLARLPPLSLGYALLCVTPTLPAMLGLAGMLWWRGRGARSWLARLVQAALLAAWVVAAGYGLVVQEASFIGYLPLLLLFGGAGVALAVALFWLARRVDGSGGPRDLRRRAIAWLGIVGAVASHVANGHFFRGAYPTLHLGVLQLSFAALATGLLSLQLGVPRLLALSRRLSVVAVLLLACAGALVGSGLCDGARPYLFGYTLFGHSRVLRARFAPRERGRGTQALVADGVEQFVEGSGMPPLPEGFSLLDYNVLLISCEALRQDQTSLHDPALKTTPWLREWSQRPDVARFDRAYSPSSVTVQSFVSLFTMTHPSAAHWRGWKKPWHGELLADNVTVPERFEAAGYDTFWIGHNYLDLFGDGIMGFEQGFGHRRLVHSERDTDHTDAKIVKLALQRLKHEVRRKRRFFGWVFLVSPHSHYTHHDKKLPGEEDIDRYRQELRYMDGQVARLMRGLERSGAADRTLVIFHGDHGEEFKEHGAKGHSRTLYSESTHVPLVVKVPGMAAAHVDTPVSLTYLFPWLFLHGDDSMRAAARERLVRDLGLMRQATGGAVVLELLGTELMKSSLVYREHKINYDHFSDLHELYDVLQDPLEQHNLFEREPALASEYAARMHRYRTLRGQLARYVIDPKRSR